MTPKDLKTVMMLYPDLEVQSSADHLHLINIHKVLAAINDVPNPKLVKLAFDTRDTMKLENKNDYFYLVFQAMRSNQEFKKVAYPMLFGEQEVKEEFDLDKWASLVYKIYDDVYTKKISIDDAIEHYADTLDKDSSEDISFKKWINYYKNGEHLKYSQAKSTTIEKEAFQFPLSGGGFYPTEFMSLPNKEVGSRFDESRTNSEKKQEYLEWKNKLNAAIRRLDKLLRQSESFVNPEIHRDLADLLHNFDQEVRSLRHEVTASDVAIKFANKFRKIGFTDGFNILTKYAQEIDPTLQEQPTEQKLEEPGLEPEPSLEQEPGLDTGLDVQEIKADGPGSSVERVFSGNGGEGGGIGLGQAAEKLEEVAGLLADRRVVRHLAEFDILLDKIGIASMFPELAEAQSKLIDAYSYALTRVTKMLGMVSSGKTLVEISDAKTKELTDKTMRDVNKTFEGKEQEPERGTPAIQEGLKEQPNVPEVAPLPVKEQPELPA